MMATSGFPDGALSISWCHSMTSQTASGSWEQWQFHGFAPQGAKSQYLTAAHTSGAARAKLAASATSTRVHKTLTSGFPSPLGIKMSDWFIPASMCQIYDAE